MAEEKKPDWWEVWVAKLAKTYGSTYLRDWARQSGSFYGSGAASGLSAGASSALADWGAGKEVDYEKAGWRAAGAAVKDNTGIGGLLAGNLISGFGEKDENKDWWQESLTGFARDAATKTLTSSGYGGLSTMAGMGIQLVSDKMNAKDTSASSMMGIFGQGMLGPIGGMVGSWYGATLDKPNDIYISVYRDKDKGPIYLDSSGNIQINPIIDVRHFLANVPEIDGHVEVGFDSAEDKKYWYEGRVKQHIDLANEWAGAMANYDNEDIGTQMQIDRFRDTGHLSTTNNIFADSVSGDGTGGRLPWLNAGEIQDASGNTGRTYYGSADMKKNRDTASTNPETHDMDTGAVENWSNAARYYSGRQDEGKSLNEQQQREADRNKWLDKLKYDEHGYTYFNDKQDRYTREDIVTKWLDQQRFGGGKAGSGIQLSNNYGFGTMQEAADLKSSMPQADQKTLPVAEPATPEGLLSKLVKPQAPQEDTVIPT